MSNGTPHILILSSWYPTTEQPFLGNFVQRHAALLAREYKVTVIHTEMRENQRGMELETSASQNVNEVRVFFKKGNRIKNKLERRRALNKALKTVTSVDLIIGHVLLPNGWTFLQAKKHYDCPLIWVEHGSYFRSDKIQNWSFYKQTLLKRLKKSANEIVAVSQTLKSDMLRKIPSAQIKVIGNHVDESIFTYKTKPAADKTHFLHTSTLDEKAKNPKGILDAVKLVSELSIDFQLTIVSDEDVQQWKEYAKEIGVESFVRFDGPVSWSDIPHYYHQADAFILNSDYETFSIVIAEALCTGTHIISTDVGIVRELPDQLVSRIKKQSPEELSNAMLSLIRSEITPDSKKLVEAGKPYHSESILEAWKKQISIHLD